jgi:hypothetical protein
MDLKLETRSFCVYVVALVVLRPITVEFVKDIETSGKITQSGCGGRMSKTDRFILWIIRGLLLILLIIVLDQFIR